MVPTNSPDFRPLYSQVKSLLIKRLADREWQPGDALPSEAALAREYGVSQGTLRKALDALEAERLVERRQGRGTFAARHSAQRALFQFFPLVDEHGERQLPKSLALSCQSDRASPAERKTLGLHAQAWVTRIHRVRHLGDRAIINEHLCVPTALFPNMHQLPPEEIPNTLYEFYERNYGVIVVSAPEQLRAVNANDEDIRVLGIKKGLALLEIDRVALNIERRPVEWRVSRCDTRSHSYLKDMTLS